MSFASNAEPTLNLGNKSKVSRRHYSYHIFHKMMQQEVKNPINIGSHLDPVVETIFQSLLDDPKYEVVRDHLICMRRAIVSSMIPLAIIRCDEEKANALKQTRFLHDDVLESVSVACLLIGRAFGMSDSKSMITWQELDEEILQERLEKILLEKLDGLS